MMLYIAIHLALFGAHSIIRCFKFFSFIIMTYQMFLNTIGSVESNLCCKIFDDDESDNSVTLVKHSHYFDYDSANKLLKQHTHNFILFFFSVPL